MKLELACGNFKEEGWIGVDIRPTEKTDVVFDLLTFPWPWDDESVDEIRCDHFVEHIPLADNAEGKDLFFCFFDEIWRILKPGGTAQITAPYYTSYRAWQDPTHRRPIVDHSFLYVNLATRVEWNVDHYPVEADFEFTYGYRFTNARWQNANDEARQFALQHYNSVADDLIVNLKKPDRQDE